MNEWINWIEFVYWKSQTSQELRKDWLTLFLPILDLPVEEGRHRAVPYHHRGRSEGNRTCWKTCSTRPATKKTMNWKKSLCLHRRPSTSMPTMILKPSSSRAEPGKTKTFTTISKSASRRRRVRLGRKRLTRAGSDWTQPGTMKMKAACGSEYPEYP